MQSKKKNNSGPKKLKKDCTIYVVAGTSTNRGNNADETFVCELETDDADGISGHSFPIELPEGNMQVREKLSNDELVSGATKFSQNPNVELSEGARILSMDKNENETIKEEKGIKIESDNGREDTKNYTFDESKNCVVLKKLPKKAEKEKLLQQKMNMVFLTPKFKFVE